MEWISVDESLPPVHMDVLVYNGIKCSVSFYDPPTVSHSLGWRWDWSEDNYEYDKVTHWMELPKVPKEMGSIGSTICNDLKFLDEKDGANRVEEYLKRCE